MLDRMERLKTKGEAMRQEYLANREKIEDEKYCAPPGQPGDSGCGGNDKVIRLAA